MHEGFRRFLRLMHQILDGLVGVENADLRIVII
jgi:hypothetical protein